MSAEIDYKAVRQRVEAKLRREKLWLKLFLLGISVVMFVIFAVTSWGMFNGGVLPPLDQWLNMPGKVVTVDPQTSALMMMTLGWLVAILLQSISVIFDTKLGEKQLRERIMGREINSELNRLGLDDVEEHEKRKGMMRLTDDGELEEVVDISDEVVPNEQMRK